MADNSWLQDTVNHPQIQAWFKELKLVHPEIPYDTAYDFIKNDTSGYDYKKAVDNGAYPKRDPGTGQLHWDDIGKTPIYWKKYLTQVMTPAIRQQEGPAKHDNLGGGRDTRTKTIRRSIPKNFDRWLTKYPQAMESGNPTNAPAFVNFMGNQGGPYGGGWAPLSVPGNETWIPGVKNIMKQNLGQPTYDYLHSMNLVKVPWEGTAWT